MLKGRIDELYAEMAAGGTTGKMPQWIPYKTCDVPGGSCSYTCMPLPPLDFQRILSHCTSNFPSLSERLLVIMELD